ncbi:MAG: hypothetical protein VKJ06_05215 [Vampirovibrionales bacterium]|nr:hypothetical protein [Vampirovibrionales bacterium]
MKNLFSAALVAIVSIVGFSGLLSAQAAEGCCPAKPCCSQAMPCCAK